jgi:hypothetical protein
VSSYELLKARQRAERDDHHPNLALRVHRALSWLNRAEQADDPDGRFIFLWIAFNAAYATEIDPKYRLTEQDTLRNQLIHGGATWGSSINRDQVRDCVGFMGKLVPLVIEVMLDNPGTLWGDACYPVVE